MEQELVDQCLEAIRWQRYRDGSYSGSDPYVALKEKLRRNSATDVLTQAEILLLLKAAEGGVRYIRGREHLPETLTNATDLVDKLHEMARGNAAQGNLTTEQDRLYHPIANIFPLLQGEEFAELKESITSNGLLEPITLLCDGSIIDGRNRHRACLETGTLPRFEQYQGAMDIASLWAYVKAKNKDRRHLTSSQWAAVAIEADELVERLEAEAKARQGARTDIREIIPESSRVRPREQLAQMYGTNPRYIQDAKRIKREAPDLLEQVRDSTLTIPQAKRELQKRQKQEAPPLPDDKYRVWYVDPPWQYNDSGVINDDNYGRAERHYPTMTIPELCAMGEGVKTRCLSDAVLFLWVTSPLLEAAFEVVQSWGFEYKTSFVWDKVRHNFGHYNSVRHEFLLVCTRGSCTPDELKLFDSVQEIERSGTHSEKPEQFREIIDTLYPNGARIELFSRKDTDGWDSWGNEAAGQHITG